jgi:hypothetical protein
VLEIVTIVVGIVDLLFNSIILNLLFILLFDAVFLIETIVCYKQGGTGRGESFEQAGQ